MISSRKAALTPPKNGTHTVNWVMEQLGPKGDVQAQGHLTAQELMHRLRNNKVDHVPEQIEIGMTVRCPIDRLVSTINHQFSKRPDYNLDNVYDHIQKAPRSLFPTQASYLSSRSDIRLFPFEGLPICRWLGWTEATIPNKYPGEYKWSREEILAHKVFPLAIERYECDFALREQVE